MESIAGSLRRLPLIFLLCAGMLLWLLPLPAQTVEVQDVYELPELSYPVIFWLSGEPDTLAVHPYYHQMQLRFSSTWHRPQPLLTAYYQSNPLLDKSLPQLLLSYKRNTKTQDYAWRAALTARTTTLLDSLIIGNYRVNAGNGLALGTLYSGKANPLLHADTGLSHASLQGIAAHFTLDHLSSALWLSRQERSLTGSTKAEETAWGALAAYSQKRWKAGAYLYQQSYDESLSPSADTAPLHTAGGYSSLALRHLHLSGEACSAKGKLALSLQAEYQRSKLSQHWHYVQKSPAFRPAYAYPHTVFSYGSLQREISWDSRYAFDKHWEASARLALVQLPSQPDKETWKERTLLSVQHTDKLGRITLSWQRLRSGIPLVSDSLSLPVSLPVQQRYLAAWSYAPAPHVTLLSRLRYSYYRKASLSRNGILLSETAEYSRKPLSLSLTWLRWTNQQTRYPESDYISDPLYLISTEQDTALRLSATWHPSTFVTISLHAYRPFHHPEGETAMLSVNAGF